MVTSAGTTRAEDLLGKAFFLTKSTESLPAADIHRQVQRDHRPIT